MERLRDKRIRDGLLTAVGVGLLLAIVGMQPLWAADDEAGDDHGPTNKIDLNRATVEELESIPGIGPALARRILDFRSKNGPFRRVEDLLKIKGIGEKSFQKMRSWVTVESEA